MQSNLPDNGAAPVLADFTPEQLKKWARTTLNEAHYQHLRAKSTMPDESLRSIVSGRVRKLSTTNGITAAIIDYVTYMGGFANRIASAGRKITSKGGKEIYIPGTTQRGTPDIDLVYRGLAIKVEVKNAVTKDRASKEQNKVKAKLQAAGAIYYTATSFEGFLSWFMTEIQNSDANNSLTTKPH